MIPNQDLDVPLNYFDDLPGFELVEIHVTSEPNDEEASEEAVSMSRETEYRAIEPTASRDLVCAVSSSVKTISSTIIAAFVSRSAISSTTTPGPPRISLSELLEVLTALTLSLFLVIIYECFGVYIYVKELPKPPPFLWKSTAAALLVMGLRYLRYGIV